MAQGVRRISQAHSSIALIVTNQDSIFALTALILEAYGDTSGKLDTDSAFYSKKVTSRRRIRHHPISPSETLWSYHFGSGSIDRLSRSRENTSCIPNLQQYDQSCFYGTFMGGFQPAIAPASPWSKASNAAISSSLILKLNTSALCFTRCACEDFGRGINPF